MLKKLLLIAPVLFALMACDNMKSREVPLNVYDPTTDLDPAPTTTITRSNANDIYHFLGHTWLLVYYLSVDVYIDHRNSDISDADVRSSLASDDIQSVNTLLFKAGIIIDKVNKIERTKEPPGYGQSNNFIYNNNNKKNLQRNSDSVDLGDGGTNFRIYINNGSGGGGIASISPRTHATTAEKEVGRNILAHEIGHLFRLLHTNDIRANTCTLTKGAHDLMLNTIFNYSLDISACEILIMRAYAARLLSKGFSWISTSPNASLDLGKIASHSIATRYTGSDKRFRVLSSQGHNTKIKWAAPSAAAPGVIGPPSEDDPIQSPLINHGSAEPYACDN